MKRLLLAAALALFSGGTWAAGAFNLFSPSDGILKGASTTYRTTAAVSADVISLWTGTCDSTTYLRADGSCVAVSASGPAVSVTPDTPPSSPTAYDDEFVYGTTIDTTGARATGANPWTLFNQSTTVYTVSQGGLTIQPPASLNVTNIRGATQPIPSGSWQFTIKVSGFVGTSNSNGLVAGLFLYNSGNSHIVESSLIFVASGSTFNVAEIDCSGATACVAVHNGPAVPFTAMSTGIMLLQPVYLRITYDGTNLNFQFSNSGYNNSFYTYYTVTAASYIGTVTDVGIFGDVEDASATKAYTFDWFRRTQ